MLRNILSNHVNLSDCWLCTSNSWQWKKTLGQPFLTKLPGGLLSVMLLSRIRWIQSRHRDTAQNTDLREFDDGINITVAGQSGREQKTSRMKHWFRRGTSQRKIRKRINWSWIQVEISKKENLTESVLLVVDKGVCHASADLPMKL